MAVKDAATSEDMGFDPYTVVRVVGTGVGGETQLVKRGENPLLYVRKVITAEFANVEAWQMLGLISHPLVPHVYGQGWRDGNYEVVYDYVSGESLADFVKRNGAVNERYAASLMIDVADAADALHSAGIVHRDISPGNVIVDFKGRAHLTDLGIARVVEEGQSRDTTRLGTWGFAAPEQYGFAQTDARSDVYSMGRLLAYICTGHMPEAVNEPFDDRSGIDELSPEISSIITTACAFEPSARFQSAEAFAMALMACVGSLPTSVEGGMYIVGAKGPKWLRALGWTALVAWAFCAFAFILAACGSFVSTEPVEHPAATFFLVIAGIVVGAYCSVQTWRALMLRGEYGQRKGRVAKLLRSYGLAIVAFLAAFMVLIIFSVVVTGAVS